MKRLFTIILQIFLMYKAARLVGKNKDAQRAKQSEVIAILEKMLEYFEKGKTLKDSHFLNSVQNVAIYGYGRLGKHVLRELEREGYTIAYIIDRSCFVSPDSNIVIYSPEHKLPHADLIIITAVGELKPIKNKLMAQTTCPIVGVKELLEN